MTSEDVTKNIWKNSVSNYLSMALRLGVGLVMFRLLYQSFSREEFGFWALLWSVFGYGILLDFGFGFTAVKRVAELSVLKDWDQLSRILSTIFYLYVAIGLLMIVTVVLGSETLVGLFQITPGNHARFREVLVWFFVGMGIAFPLGIFPEILIGQQRILLANVLFSIGIVGNAIVTLYAISAGWSFRSIVAIGLVSGIVPCLLSAWFALRSLPQVRILPSLFSWNKVHDTMRFSIFAYVSTVSNILLAKTDQVVLSTALAVSAVAIYQAGAKIGEMFNSFTQQLPDAFSPAAAHLHAKGDKAFLRQLLVNGTRFSVMIATPLYCVCAFYMDGLLRLLTGDAIPARETFWVGQILLLWGYSNLITQGVSKRIFMMCGHERRLMKLSVGEALLNLGLSVGLVLHFKSVLCVAVGSLIASVVFGWFFLWPWAAREAGVRPSQLARTILVPIWVACLPLLGFVILARSIPWLDFRGSIPILAVESFAAMLLATACLWRTALTDRERETVLDKLGKTLRIRTSP